MADRALLIVDVQNDFCPGGALGVREGDAVVPVLNEYMEHFREHGLPVLATRDWHPPNTRHFREFGGPWPPHCVQNTPGASFHEDLRLPEGTAIITKGTSTEDHGYSAFEGHDASGRPLAEVLRKQGIHQIYIGGLATDYCVLNSVLDARREGFESVVLLDAVRGIDVSEGDVDKAIEQMKQAGARMATLETIDTELTR